MTQSVSYAFIYLFEVFSCFMFFENIYQRKVKNTTCFLFFLVSFVLQYGLSFLGIPYFNLVLFFICNFLISILGYISKIKTKIFISLSLSALMVITEIIVVHLTSIVLKMDFSPYQDNFVTIMTQASLSKLLFFTTIFFIAKIFKSHATRQQANRHTILLGILPLSSLSILIVILRIGMIDGVSNLYHTALVICSIFLLFANLFVFYIYEMAQKANFEINQLQLEKQRSEISSEHYDLLYNEIENFRILKHDIKNHLRHISNKTSEGDLQGISDYIKSISEDFGLDARIQYSGNKLIDVILNRHMTNCKQNGLVLEIGSCGSNLEFMSETDTIALLDNLFENAIEAASKSTDKKLSFSMYRKANNYTVTDYIVITLTNSCDNAPRTRHGELVTSKSNSNSHGIGTKSIKRIVNKYNGNFDWQYDEENKEFKTSVILHVAS